LSAITIPLSRPDIGEAEEQAVLEVLRSGILAMGPRTLAFEEAWAEYCGVRHAILMANGTLAQEAILRGLGIGVGDEVITVSFTFNATASVILQVGAKPVFVDIRDEDFGMDPDLVEAAITPRTKAIMPVHLYGLMPDMDPLVEIARRHDLTIVEDAAQAHGARYRGKRAGQFGPAMFSLYATKNLMTGEGGFVTTDDDALADRLRIYRSHGMRRRYFHESLGTNFKPTDITAALGLAQLPRLDERTERRRRNAARLTEGLAGYLTPRVPEGREHVWHQYTMRFPGEREKVIEGLTERGIGTLIYYPKPIHQQDYLQSYVPGAAELFLPVTELLTDEVLSIPVRPSLTDEEVDTVIRAVREVATPVADLPDLPGRDRAGVGPEPSTVGAGSER
jgi:perosamine synthetase